MDGKIENNEEITNAAMTLGMILVIGAFPLLTFFLLRNN
jgi:hypothetical protein